MGGPIDRTLRRLRVIMPAVSRRPTLLILAMFAAAALSCGPKSGGTGPREVDLGAYPALRWAPADVTYLGVVGRVDATVTALRDLTEALGILGDFDPSEVSGEVRAYLGVDILSVDDLAAAGVDTAAGGVVWSQGLSPTLVFKLADPPRMQSRIEEQRDRTGPGVAIGNSLRDGVEVFTSLAGHDVHTHWAIDGEWMWLHFEIVDEKEAELGWFDASRAAKGAGAKDPDLAWARGEADRIHAGAVVIGMLRPATIAARFAALIRDDDAAACFGLVTPKRAALTLSAANGVSEGHVVFDLAGGGGAAAIAAMTLPAPQGWAAARGEAPLAAEWNVDALALAARLKVCEDDFEQELTELGIRSFRVFLADLDADFNGHAAASADLSTRRWIDRQIDITGRSMFESKRKYGPLDGKRLEAPMIPAVDYILDDQRAMVGLGDGVLARVVGDGTTTPPAVLAALDVRPNGLPDGAWDVLLQHVAGVGRDGARELTIRRLKKWSRGTVKMSLDGETLHISARGER